MRIMPPLEIGTSQLLESPIPEPDTAAGEQVWAPSTAYAAGVERIRTQTHRRYVALADIPDTATTPPELAPTQWREVAPTNRYAMFDYTRTRPSVFDASGEGGAVVRIQPGVRASAIALYGVLADEVTINHYSDIGGELTRTLNVRLLRRFTTSWYEYLTGRFTQRTKVLLLRLPALTSGVFEVVFKRSAGPAQCAFLAVGQPIYVGTLERGCSSDLINFGEVRRLPGAEAELIPGRSVPEIVGQLFIEKERLAQALWLRDNFQNKPLVMIPLEDPEDAYFDPFSTVGILRNMSLLVPYPTKSVFNLEVEGL